MTDGEKKMKRYCSAVERRLNLPRDVRVRVMNDFASSIQARREANMTDGEIYGELGSPKKAAADLNEQMKEYAFRKSPWRFAFAALAVFGAWQLLGTVAGELFMLLFPLVHSGSGSVGIIGGADGPTAVFLTTNVPQWYHRVIPVLLLSIGVLGFFRLRRCVRK